jgi:hypothetical protein
MNIPYIVILIGLLCCTSMAQVPSTMNYQGLLTGPDGITLATPGTYEMTFTLTTQPLGDGGVVWSETQNVQVYSGGYFSALLGAEQPLDEPFMGNLVLFNEQYYLAVKARSGSIVYEFGDRIQLASAPYAHRSRYVDSVRLNDLVDVEATTPSEGHVLQYSAGQWRSRQVAGTSPNVHSLNGASGVVTLRVGPGLHVRTEDGELIITLDTVGAMTGQGLRFNGRAWESGDLVPIGTVMAFAGEDSQLPDGWEYCDGRSLLRSEYPRLYSVIGTTYGNVQGSQYFNVPDYRGAFLRGVDTSYALNRASGRDVDRSTRTPHPNGNQVGNRVGTVQEDAFQGHVHAPVTDGYSFSNVGSMGVHRAGNIGSAPEGRVGEHFNAPDGSGLGTALPTKFPNTNNPVIKAGMKNGSKEYPNFGDPRLSLETRPYNVSVHWIIKAR